MEIKNFKKLTFEQMKEYIEKNAPQDKAWFKKVAFQNADGTASEKYNHLNAAREFCKKYMPNLLPVAKPKAPNKTDCLKDW